MFGFNVCCFLRKYRPTFATFCVCAGMVFTNAIFTSCTRVKEYIWPVDIILQDEFVTYTSVDSIPKPLINAIANPVDAIAIAEPDEEYNETHILDENRSSRRLIFAGHSEKHWFIYYEHGDWQGSRIKLAMFEFTNKHTVPVFEVHFVFFNKAPDFKVLRRLIASAQVVSISAD